MHSMYCRRGKTHWRMLSCEITLTKMLIWWQPASLTIKYSNHYISFISGLAPALGQPLPCRRADRAVLMHTDLLVQTPSFPKEAKLNLKNKPTLPRLSSFQKSFSTRYLSVLIDLLASFPLMTLHLKTSFTGTL